MGEQLNEEAEGEEGKRERGKEGKNERKKADGLKGTEQKKVEEREGWPDGRKRTLGP